jgi:MoaA/NifB/PqqE/SkfB family radical SAM enzyme
MEKVNITAWKALHFKELLTKIAPTHWDIDLTMICNHRCKGCFYIGLPEDGFDSSLEVFRDMNNGSILNTELTLKIIKEIAEVGGKAITFVGGGEPTLHPKIVDIFTEVKRNNLKFGLVSHFGLSYKQEFFSALLDATWVRVSTNAATNQTYQKIQGIKKSEEFERVCNNIKTFASMGGNIGVSFLIHPDNVGEIPYAASLYRGLGAKYIQYKPYITDKKNNLWDDWNDAIINALDIAKAVEDKNFRVLDQFQNRRQQLVEFWNKQECGKCWVHHFNPKLTATGKLYICCELAYSDKGLLGDLNSTSIKELISSGRWAKVQEEINTNNCPPCWERPLNKSINDGTFNDINPPIKTIDMEFV